MTTLSTTRSSRILPTSLLVACLLTFSSVPADAQVKRLSAAERRVVEVSPVTGDDYASGTALLAAQAQAAASPHHWLLHLSPGTYDLGERELVMSSNVSIEGSGPEATFIVGRGIGTVDYSRGVVEGADGARLAELTVQCVNDDQVGQLYGIAMANFNASPRLHRVRLISEGAGNHWGMRNTNSSPVLEEVEILAIGGVHNYGIVDSLDSFTEIQRSIVTAQDGSQQNVALYGRDGGHPVRIDDSEIYAVGGTTAIGLFNDGTVGGESVLDDVVVQASQAATNAAIYGGNYTLEVHDSSLGASGADGTAIELDSLGQLVATDSELLGDGTAALAGTLLLGATRVGGGTVGGDTTSCSGVYRIGAQTQFFADQCPTSQGFVSKRKLRVYEIGG